MSVELIHRLSDVTRRGFLGRVVAASVALLSSLFGIADEASGLVSYLCCTLCNPPQAGTCPPLFCECRWHWVCCWPPYPQQGYWVECWECFTSAIGGCDGCGYYPAIVVSCAKQRSDPCF